ncbi:MAG: hypothetical protein SLAVMIC_00918 [uncultured marine phage]|uniref:Uncharacterized protein n=1 Tax=uncultured marine phage TaxID=707152 RepID=A0A8D9C9S6_9VIRU|nr:MAG: hypothetical protein SLAVMIC_00918 [uncultured marine phage]
MAGKIKLKYKSRKKSIKGYRDSKLAKTEHSDCSVCSVATAFDITYNRAHKFVKETYKRKNGKGVHVVSKNDKFADNQTILFGKTINQIGEHSWFSERPNDRSPIVKKGDEVRRMTVGRFVKENPKGTFLILIDGHIFTIKNSTVLGGNLEDSKKLKVRVQKAWEVLS